MVGASKLGASGGEATTGSEGGGHSGPDSGGVHLKFKRRREEWLYFRWGVLTLSYREERVDDRKGTDEAEGNISRCGMG